MAEGEMSAIEINRPSEGDSPPGVGRGRTYQESGKKATEREALTFWTRQMDGLVRPLKESDRIMGTHFLKMADVGTCQDKE